MMHSFKRSVLPVSSLLAFLFTGCGGAIEEETASSQQMASALVLSDQGFGRGFYLPLNDVVMAEEDDVKVVANGNVAVSFADSNFEGTVNDDGELDRFKAHFGLEGALTVELAVEGGGALAGVLELVTIPLASIDFGPAIEVTPYAQVRLLLTGTAEGGARVSMVAPFHVGAAFSGAGSPAGALSSPPRFDPEIGLPDVFGNFEGTIELEVDMTFLVSIQGVPVGGPVVGAKLAAILGVDTAPPAWTLNGRVKVVGGWAFLDPTTLLPDVPVDLPRLAPVRRWNIAGGMLPEIAASTRWSKVFDVLRDDNAGAALLSGTDLLVVEGGGNPWLASLDATGLPQWQSAAIDGWTPSALVLATNGDLLVAGVNSDGYDMRVERYDLAGAPDARPLWRSTLTMPGAEVDFTAIVATAGDGAILSGEVTHSDGVKRPILAGIDALGNVQWSNEIEIGAGSANAMILALAQTPGGEILAVGQVDDIEPDLDGSTDGRDALVLRLDALGNPGTAHTIGGSHAQSAHHVVVHADGSYAIGGELDAFAPHEAWIASLDATDSLLWSSSYQSRPDVDGNGEQASVSSLASLNGNGLLVSGYIGSASVDAWVLRVNAGGMPVWLKTYASPDEDKLNKVLALPDGLVAFGGTGFTETVSSYTDLWLVRTDVDGMLHFPAGSEFDAQNTAVQWQEMPEHETHVLPPVTVIPSNLVTTPVPFTAGAASVTGELLTD